MSYLDKFENDVNKIAEDLDFVGKLEKAQIRIDEDVKPPPAVLKIDNNTMNHVTVFTEGNISVIQGQAKVRKSFAVAMLISGVISDHPVFRKLHSSTKKKVFYFDTEQSKYYVQSAYRRIAKMSNGYGINDRLFVFSLRPYTPTERVELIEYVFENIKDIGFVVIDGIRDLISNINDPDESTMIASKLLKWTDSTQAHVLNILHENKSEAKARGHIGTELVNKSETILRVEKLKKDEGVSKLSCEMVRGLDFDPIYFRIIDDLPEVISNYIEDVNNF